MDLQLTEYVRKDLVQVYKETCWLVFSSRARTQARALQLGRGSLKWKISTKTLLAIPVKLLNIESRQSCISQRSRLFWKSTLPIDSMNYLTLICF